MIRAHDVRAMRVTKAAFMAIVSQRIALVVLCGLAFLRLVFADYGYIR